MVEKAWIEVPADSLDTDDKLIESGVEISVGLSPFDIPEGVRGFYDEAIERFVIQFKYLDADGKERRTSVKPEAGIELCVGEYSGCLYEIHVDVDQIGANAVQLKLYLQKAENAVRKFSTHGVSPRIKKHFKVVEEVLERNGDLIVAQ